ncbi:hypothetical protein [Halochromatium roseum]|uniref:hypothetical protein n=1 Tax=Halochromatium roseum TaxID=391920 RepID=UPI00191335C4|nr:hypothetical protein [Halochromatium roseum]MBK5941169.1 hypothetical protein [Halochromatium roseum]
MSRLLLLGGGGHCRACIDVIEAGASGQIKRPDTRGRLFNLVKHHGAKLPVIQSPTAYGSRHADHCHTATGARVNGGVRIGKGASSAAGSHSVRRDAAMGPFPAGQRAAQ